MTCMKCGREMDSEQVFCEDCLLEMEKYPVKPGTAVQLPSHKGAPPVRKSQKRRVISPEEQILRLKKRVWFLSGVLAVALLLILFMIQPTVNYFLRSYYLRPGQNYSTVTPSTTAAITTAETTDPFEGMAE